MRGRLSADRDEISQLGRQERVVPAGHQQHRRRKRAGATLPVDRRPVGVGLRMEQPIVEERHIADRAVIGLDHGKPVEPALQRRVRRVDVDAAAATRGPVQRRFERERAAGVEHLAKARARNVDQQCGRAGRALIRERPLRMAEYGAAPHAEPAVEPGLACQPLQRLDAVLAFVPQRIERAARIVAPARALHHDGVSALRPEAGNGVGTESVPEGAAERNPHQNRRGGTCGLGTMDVGGERHSVGCGHACAAFGLDCVLRRADAVSRQNEIAHHGVASTDRQHGDQQCQRPDDAVHESVANGHGESGRQCARELDTSESGH